MKETLFGKKQAELVEIAVQQGLPAFNGRQITEWLYKKGMSSFDGMSSLSKKTRELLNQNFDIGLKLPLTVHESADGTKKYLFPAGEGLSIESAYIPDRERATLCISTQVGCRMGCRFCMTARQGLQGQLTCGEILNQYQSLPERETVTNIVYMGMGEPFDNLENVVNSLEILTADWGYGMSPRRITVSTIGLVPEMKEFLEKSKCHLAISLHSPFETERRDLMPAANKYPIRDILEVIRDFDFGLQRRISFEYIMFRGLNDTPRHVNELARILHGIKCRINLIRFHPIPGTPLESSDDRTMQSFQQALKDKGIITTIRASRGRDIAAACGMLSTTVPAEKKRSCSQ
ncbi:MAG TPA: 23S rRNA (adenine(2503)-C(2))-methyltransferase RlmN [Bacteroidales bacterium]|nr:23S rRNA (adenine(2503)-C(2))-methyltransferase RlmN [Bacteroidales bacterium]